MTDEQIDALWFEVIKGLDEASKRPRPENSLRKHIREMANRIRKERGMEKPRVKLKRLKRVILPIRGGGRI